MTPEQTSMTGVFKFPQADRSAERAMLTGAGTYATVLLVWACDRLGFDVEKKMPNVFLWSPETVLREIKDTTGVAIPKRNFDKLMAAVAVITTDAFFQDVKRFIQLANILAGDDFDPEVFDPADATECAWAVTEGLLLWPPDEDEQEPFCDDIRHYIGKVLRDEGFVKPPDILRIALDADFSATVTHGFSDDPEMFAAIHKNQEDKAADVAAALHQGLTEMLSQLSALRLETGTTEDIAAKIGQAIRKTTQGDRP